jgi:membrane-associated phospholipid phosphatase
MRWKTAPAIVRLMNGSHRLQTRAPAGRPDSLAPPGASVVATVAVLVAGAMAALVWTRQRPDGVDAWAVQALTVSKHSSPYRFASRLDDTTRIGGVLAASTALAVLAWFRLRRRDAVIASLLVAPATVAVEQSFKLAPRRSHGLESFSHYPSGRVALATSLVLLLGLILRAAGARPFVQALVAVLGTLYVLLMAWARVATGQHSFTDVLGGISVGVAVTLATVLVLTAWRQGNPQRGY